MASSKGISDARFERVAKALSDQNAAYIERRRLPKSKTDNHITFIIDLADTTRQQQASSQLGDLLKVAVSQRKQLSVVGLNVLALLALQRSDWDGAQLLAGEVIARDHHDLMAQKIVDAAAEQSTTLETETDRWLAGRQCNAPFRQFETRVNKTVHFCCSAWQPVPIGAFDKQDDQSFWNSETAKELRRSVVEGDFSYCSRWHCPAIAARRLPKTIETHGDTPPAPKRVILSHDRSCNISCPSCRKDLILLNHKSSEALNKVFDQSLKSYVVDADEVKVTGSGDPFGSRHFRHILKTICSDGPPRKRIQLHTNGLLANERAWNDLNLWGNVSSVWVSIDAAQTQTYSVLRRGGVFEDLVKNLEFMGRLREAGSVDSLRLDFVVQYDNFDEMGDFVDLAQRVKADKIYFLRLRNWGHVAPGDFQKLDICDARHPEHGALLDRLRDPRLAQANVDLGSVTPLRKTTGPTYYYD